MTRYCVIYRAAGRERCSAWFTSRARADLAQGVLARRFGATVIYRD